MKQFLSFQNTFTISVGISFDHFNVQLFFSCGEYLLPMWYSFSSKASNDLIPSSYRPRKFWLRAEEKSPPESEWLRTPHRVYESMSDSECDGILGYITTEFKTPLSSVFRSGVYFYRPNRLLYSLNDGGDVFLFPISNFWNTGFVSDEKEEMWNVYGEISFQTTSRRSINHNVSDTIPNLNFKILWK